MTTISAKIIADSISQEDIRLTTMELRYPRAIHAEFMTHRVFSRNAASSRAIPVSRLIQDVLDDPFVPLHWGKNQKGMQALEECAELVSSPTFSGGCEDLSRSDAWLRARDFAVGMAEAFAEAGYHKQVVNRILEPFAHINVVVTATDWANFLHLRDHADAEPHIAMLAREVKASMDGSRPALLQPGEWHLPYADDEETYQAITTYLQDQKGGALLDGDDLKLFEEISRKLSVARCASVSYKTVDGQPMTIERATELHDKLVVAEPLHASPAEHQATPDQRYTARILQTKADPKIYQDCDDGSKVSLNTGAWNEQKWLNSQDHGNFRGWRQYRKMLPNEAVAG